jgi:hypothetical protein
MAGARAVAECLGSITALARIPLIDNHFDGHAASPDAGRALLFVGSSRESPMTAFAIDRKRRWNTTPRWRRCLFSSLTRSDFQIADLVKLNSLKTWLGNPQRFTRDGVTRLELVFGVGCPSPNFYPASKLLDLTRS